MSSTFGRFSSRILGIAVGGIFIYAGILKAVDPVQFGLDIDNFKILPWFVSVRLAFYLPWLEMLCGLALLFRVFYRGGLLLLNLLVLIFIGATVAAKVRGLDITCGCFGHASQRWSFPQHMAIDFAIFIALIGLFWIELVGGAYHDQKS